MACFYNYTRIYNSTGEQLKYTLWEFPRCNNIISTNSYCFLSQLSFNRFKLRMILRIQLCRWDNNYFTFLKVDRSNWMIETFYLNQNDPPVEGTWLVTSCLPSVKAGVWKSYVKQTLHLQTKGKEHYMNYIPTHLL